MIFDENKILTSQGLIPARIVYTCYLAMDPIKLLTYSFINQRLEWQPIVFSSFETITTLLVSINQSFYCSRNISLPNNLEAIKSFFMLDLFDHFSSSITLNTLHYNIQSEIDLEDSECLDQFREEKITTTIGFDQIMTYPAYSFVTNLNHNYFVAINNCQLILTQF